MSKIVQPTYIAKLPSNNKVIKFRPFTVREEKALLLALQEDSTDIIVEAIKNLVSACTNEAVDPSTLPYYDVEYLFLQIRAKSVGEIVDLIGSCECNEKAKTEFSVNITDIVIDPPVIPNPKIKIPDTKYTIEVRHPSIDDFTKTFDDTDNSSARVVANCITRVFTDEEIMDWSYDETLDFVESMSPLQQKDIAAFLKTMPLVKIPSVYTCRGCGKEHKSSLTGFQNFFI